MITFHHYQNTNKQESIGCCSALSWIKIHEKYYIIYLMFEHHSNQQYFLNYYQSFNLKQLQQARAIIFHGKNIHEYNQLAINDNKIIMKVNRERNLYLKRIFTEEPHTYSYDIGNGSYSLVDQSGCEYPINNNGVLKQRFRPNISGCANHKIREKQCRKDPSILHYSPDAKTRSKFLNIIPSKFAGYAQYPYKLQQSPSYLRDSTKINPFSQRTKMKHHSLTQPSEERLSQRSIILSQSLKKSENGTFFKRAWGSISMSKPTPSDKRKTCYNHKCKFLKKIAFQELISRKEKQENFQIVRKQTFGKKNHEEFLKEQLEQLKRLTSIRENISKK